MIEIERYSRIFAFLPRDILLKLLYLYAHDREDAAAHAACEREYFKFCGLAFAAHNNFIGNTTIRLSPIFPKRR